MTLGRRTRDAEVERGVRAARALLAHYDLEHGGEIQLALLALAISVRTAPLVGAMARRVRAGARDPDPRRRE